MKIKTYFWELKSFLVINHFLPDKYINYCSVNESFEFFISITFLLSTL